MRAASIISDGMLMINCRIRKIPKAGAINGIVSDQYESVHPNWLMKIKSGTRINWKGIIVEPSSRINRGRLPLKRYLANPNPASDVKNSCAIVRKAETTKLL